MTILILAPLAMLTYSLQGFRMTVGSPTNTDRARVGLSYQCLSGRGRGPELNDFPTGPCPGGIFTTHHFPASASPPSPPPGVMR